MNDINRITGTQPQVLTGFTGNAKSRQKEPAAPRDELVRDLQQENQDLKRQLAELKQQTKKDQAAESSGTGRSGKIEFDMGTDLLKMRNVRTRDLLIDRLDVRAKGSGKAISDMLSVSSLMKGDGKLPTDAVQNLQNQTMEIEDARIRVPQEAACRAMLTTKKDSLKKEGVKNVSMSFHDGNRVSVEGTVKKIFNIPFKIDGSISSEGNNKVRYTVNNMRVGRLIKLPGLVKSIILSLTEDSVADDKIVRDGNSYIMDASSFIPKNIKVQLKNIGAENGFLVIEGKSPGREKGRTSNSPRTMLME